MNRLPAIGAVILCAILAGCLSQPDSSSTVDVSYERQSDFVGFSDETSLISGLVTDEELNPLAGVTVVLDGAEIRTTQEDGTFRFDNVAPGEYLVAASLPNHEAAQRIVQATAGEISRANFQLLSLARANAYFEIFQGTGMTDCDVAIRGVTSSNSTYAYGCAYSSYAGVALSEPVNFETGPITGVVGYWAETTWSSSQPFGAAMVVQWLLQSKRVVNVADYADPDWRTTPSNWHTIEAISPIVLRIPIEEVRAATDPNGQLVCQADDKCFLISGHWAAAGALGPDYPVDFGITYQQRFDEYLTVFHGGEFPQSFTALPDA